jgi:hypothetical protein
MATQVATTKELDFSGMTTPEVGKVGVQVATELQRRRDEAEKRREETIAELQGFHTSLGLDVPPTRQVRARKANATGTPVPRSTKVTVLRAVMELYRRHKALGRDKTVELCKKEMKIASKSTDEKNFDGTVYGAGIYTGMKKHGWIEYDKASKEYHLTPAGLVEAKAFAKKQDGWPK